MAIDPTSILHSHPEAAADLMLTLATLDAAVSLGDLERIRSRSLVRLGDGVISDYFFGTRRTGVVLRPADRRGHATATVHTLEGLMKIQTVVILSVGLALSQVVGQ